VDSNWNFTGEKSLLSDYLYYLDYNSYEYKKTNNGIIPISEIFDFYVSYQNEEGDYRWLSNISNEDLNNTDTTPDDWTSWLTDSMENYILRRNNAILSDNVSSGDTDYYSFPTAETGFYQYDYDGIYYDSDNLDEEYYPDNFVPVGGWYYDNYGRYFYNFGNEDPIRFFDSSKNTDRGQIARQGGKDVAFSYVTGTEISEDRLYLYDHDEYYYSWQAIEHMDNYEATDGYDEGITVFISPKKDYLENASKTYASTLIEYKATKIICVASIVLAALLFVYLIASCGFYQADEETVIWKKPNFFGKRSVEIYLVAGIALFVAYFAVETVSSIYIPKQRSVLSVRLSAAAFTLIFAVICFLFIFSVMQLVEKIKTKTFKENLLIPQVIRKILEKYHASEYYQSYQQLTMGQKLKRRSVKAIILLIVIPLLVLFELIIIGYDEDSLLLGIILLIIAICFEVKNIRDFKDMSKISRQIKALGTDEAFDEKISEKSALYNDYLMLTQISEKVKNSVEEQIKSERMKIELVANVSHDLKTPLTSIIGYIDLLKKLELDDEASSYVQILDKKSQKLKSIVYDVFSLAKATSGIDVNLAEIDFVVLFNQALADADDKIKNSGKTLKIDISEQSATVMADGDKMYRVFQNLIDNALNYSLEGSRIFLEVKREGDNILYKSKNVSSYPIEFTADEIVERFVRGDKSRTDGGSGLGLSIAKSFTEACGGEFTIDLDGDVFKTTVSMPILNKEEKSEIDGLEEI
jgi:signal transduction histidine kinase